MFRITQFILFLFLMTTLNVAALAENNATTSVVVAKNKKQFISELVTKNHFNRQQLTALLRSLQPNKAIIHSMTAPFEKQPWSYYHNFFLTPERITLGAAYMRTHHRELIAMQEKYGIPASIITAIIGVETEYGLHLGKYNVLQALYTLGFYYPPRETFFRKELAQYLILARKNHLDIQNIRGSYAGALGIPQFMPSSYRYYGVSASRNGRVNLFHHNDAIASVANYFHKMGWKPNQPITQQLRAKHAHTQESIAVITLPMKSGNQYWAAYPNFKVIMTYNHNIVYAMAVYQLAQAIEKKYQQKKTREL